jgi:DNA-binding XRE family transcriptional regulator
MATLHNRIAVYRAELDVSRKDLADAAGVHVQTIGFIERGDYSPSLEVALRIAQRLGAPVEAVFSLAPFPPLAVQLGGRSDAPASKIAKVGRR